ncbi:MAG: efflux RND transporter periplasmic adaptor subunit [Leptospiraceae bacterium]|nr:efflux RND transporter periplasmic adaptor subunit [Leptospiraceae bacterium]NUM41997.1 efflux RND transporter periplasmic adaptor subunit [Leptospiraceae bacterium]
MKLISESNGAIIRKQGKGRLPSAIVIDEITTKNLGVKLTVPIRVSVSCVANSLGGKAYLFETQEQSAVYTEYLKNKAALYGAKKSYSRLKYLVENQAAPGKELSDAQVQLEQMSAALEENNNRLKLLGVPIEKLNRLPVGWVFVIAEVPESKMDQIKPGNQITLKFSAFPSETIKAKIQEISDVVDTISRTTKVRILLQNTKQHLKPGMYGSGQIEEVNIPGLALPNEALILIGEDSYVFREEDDGSFSRVKVQTGIEADLYTQIVSGLEKGDRVVVRGTGLLKGISFGY